MPNASEIKANSNELTGLLSLSPGVQEIGSNAVLGRPIS